MEGNHLHQQVQAPRSQRYARGRGGGESGNSRRFSKSGRVAGDQTDSAAKRNGFSGGPKQAWRERNPSQSTTRSQKVDVLKGVPHLVQELQDKLRKGDVECMICYDMVGRNAPVWSCSSCFSIFHLTCIRKWARTPAATDRAASAVEVNWRCPGCQSLQHTAADELRYWCFCGQQIDPSVDYYLTPHSCGGTCMKPLNKAKVGDCTHLCTLQCHPGPCPPCVAVAAPEACGCGKTSVTRRCAEKDGSVVSCGQQCDRMLSCARHSCNRVCHNDDCERCKETITVRCFCQRIEEVLICGQVSAVGELTSGGIISCESPCSKLLSCGNHSCSKECHPGECGDCELSLDNVTTCPCSKRSLRELLTKGTLRKSCLDPVPTCGQVCGKLMNCKQHRCESVCHVGPCPPCGVLVEQKCRCGGSSRTVPCSTATAEDEDHAFICFRKCGRKRSCGRHRCNNRCCPSSQDADHLCMLECGKKLRCGVHFCEELCHPGHCQPCLRSSFTDLTCACGRSSIPPPVACGTPPPRCEHPCALPQPCGHTVAHTCHFGECPPCVVPVAKECVGKHTVVRSVPCGSKEIKCSQTCGKLRKCGLHACGKTCHSGPCDEQNSTSLSCGQVCGAPRSDCSHTCVAACHPWEPCPNLRCNFTVTITCSCDRLSANVPCDTGGGSTAGSIAAMLLPSLQPVQSAKDRVPLSQRKIACDDECGKAQRLKALADALGIHTTTGDALSSYGDSDALQEMIRKDSQFVTAVEDRFRYLLLGPKATVACSTGLRVHAFCALPKDKREVIHQLAQRWSLSVSSVGWEPRRYMIVYVNSKSRMPGRSTKMNPAAPVFSPGLDVDPKQVVALVDLPREGDISSLVLRFGGECELIWLNDRNALAVFADPARAATAMKRVDHATSYPGAFVLPQSVRKPVGWGLAAASATQQQRSSSSEVPHSSHAWDDEQQQQQSRGVWQKRKTVVAVSNPWTALEQAAGGSSGSSSCDSSGGGGGGGGGKEISSLAGVRRGVANLQAANAAAAVVDDWESAFE